MQAHPTPHGARVRSQAGGQTAAPVRRNQPGCGPLAGPLSTHTVSDIGQVIYPGDDASSARGPVGDLMGRWYLGWSDQ